MSNVPSQQPFNVAPNHRAPARSKFNPHSVAYSRRQAVLAEMSARLTIGKKFADLQDPGVQESVIKRRSPQLAKEKRDE